MSDFAMSGRIYNAVMKFAGGTKIAPQFENMFYNDGKVYATDSYAICRWTPADKYEVLDNITGKKIDKFFFIPHLDKIAAASVISIDSGHIDIDTESQMPNDIDKLFNDNFPLPVDSIMGVNPKYLSMIAALGKAVKSDKCMSEGTVQLDWANSVLHAHIDAGKKGSFDVVVMPIADMTKINKE